MIALDKDFTRMLFDEKNKSFCGKTKLQSTKDAMVFVNSLETFVDFLKAILF